LPQREKLKSANKNPHNPEALEAAKAGIEIGDVITSANGEAVNHWPDLSRKVVRLAPGASVEVGIIRQGQDRTVMVTLGEFPRTVVTAKKQKRIN